MKLDYTLGTLFTLCCSWPFWKRFLFERWIHFLIFHVPNAFPVSPDKVAGILASREVAVVSLRVWEREDEEKLTLLLFLCSHCIIKEPVLTNVFAGEDKHYCIITFWIIIFIWIIWRNSDLTIAKHGLVFCSNDFWCVHPTEKQSFKSEAFTKLDKWKTWCLISTWGSWSDSDPKTLRITAEMISQLISSLSTEN